MIVKRQDETEELIDEAEASDEFEFFREAYKSTPPWDVGHPQQVFKELAQAGQILGSVLDVGCGTGEHALMAAKLGHEVWGVDMVDLALAKARAKARKRRLKVEFRKANALDLGRLGRSFDTVIDSGLFHAFDDEERERYARSLKSVLNPGGRLYILCFSEHARLEGGPRRVTQDEIRLTFSEGWRVLEIRPSHFEVVAIPEGVDAWLAAIERLP